MITPSNAVVEPLAVVVESVHAPVADVAVAAARQNYDRASRADLPHLELFKQVHHRHAWVFLDESWANDLHQEGEEGPGQEAHSDGRLQPLFLFVNHVGEDDGHQEDVADKHDREEADHGLARTAYLVHRLLKFECAFDALHAALVDSHGVLEELDYCTLPVLIFDLFSGVFKRSSVLFVS